jgi:hypothetical protein
VARLSSIAGDVVFQVGRTTFDTHSQPKSNRWKTAKQVLSYRRLRYKTIFAFREASEDHIVMADAAEHVRVFIMRRAGRQSRILFVDKFAGSLVLDLHRTNPAVVIWPISGRSELIVVASSFESRWRVASSGLPHPTDGTVWISR